MPFVYILECHDKSFYVGSTTKSPHDREAEHNLGLESAYTRRPGRRPVRIVWWEQGDNIDADSPARSRCKVGVAPSASP